MSSSLYIPDFDEAFRKTISPTIVNDLPNITTEERAAFNAVILTSYETDILSNVPTCGCGLLQSGHNLYTTCPRCKTKVLHPTEGEIDLRTWIKIPEGQIGFISPIIWAQLTNKLNKKGYNILEWMTSSRTKPPKKLSSITAKRIAYLESINWPRGLNNFILNFDIFINEVLPAFTKNKDQTYYAYLRAIKDKIFPKHLPLPTKAMIIVENTQVGTFADNASILGAIDAARTISYISAPRTKPLSFYQVEAKVVDVIMNLVDYYTVTMRTTFCTKNGWLRGQVFCSRSHFCLRGVITSISEPHSYEELHIPWAQAVEIFKIHLISKLINQRGFDYISAYSLVESTGNVYNPLIDELFQELIAEAPEIERAGKYYDTDLPKTGIKCILQRNPSLHRLSAQLLAITKIKTDLTDKTISLSILAVKGPNADFDGDSRLYL